ncbi:BON domain-containing protein [Castellaniella sp. UC4442_H9]|jgi:osmotically-inducible protein OsmY|nr:BON domain-containing protein [Castellaniella sp.]
MKIARQIAFSVVAGLATITLVGCSVANKQESVGEYVDGSVVTAQVKAKLANDPDTSALDINVKTIQGGIVQLSGFAKSQHEKNRAAELARTVKGVTEVRNNITVVP